MPRARRPLLERGQGTNTTPDEDLAILGFSTALEAADMATAPLLAQRLLVSTDDVVVAVRTPVKEQRAVVGLTVRELIPTADLLALGKHVTTVSALEALRVEDLADGGQL
jgi:hypothetical protein